MLQDEPRNPDEDPTTETPEEGDTLEENLISVVNNNPVIIGAFPYDRFVAPRDQSEEWI